MTEQPAPQLVRWGPSDAPPAGIRAWTEGGDTEDFVAWSDLRQELKGNLLLQLFADPRGFTFQTAEYNGKPDWLVQVVGLNGNVFCHVWFGNNPDENFEFDGLIRLGDPDDEEPHAWQTYQRFSDGTYRRLPSRAATLDEFRRQK